jgi:two-component system, chemotaxis family, chemotaxis protein CheY
VKVFWAVLYPVGAGMKIMIVDDSERMRQMIRTFIADLSSDIVECEDGAEALETYRTHRPDLVLMDLKMVRMDGLAATSQILESFPHTRIVIVSQWDDAPFRAAARRVGAEAVISKSDLLPLRSILATL